jgi:hypothetical protein
MNQPRQNRIIRIAGRKLAVVAIIAASAASSFATLGDGKKKNTRSNSVLISNKPSYKPGSFSLRSGFSFRGSQVMNTATQEKKVIRINTTVTLQRGNTTYTMPLKKNVIMGGKVQFGIRNGTISNQR